MTEEERGGSPARLAPEEDRRSALVRVAHRHIAERGFEGLRVRAVAAEAGINHATLLHYFPTKEALIQGVVLSLVREFGTSRAPGGDPTTAAAGPLEEVRREFADVRHRLRTTPETFAVIGELSIRARRDPAIARILRGLEEGWRAHLVGILERGIVGGAFRSDLDAGDAAMALMAQLAAVGYRALDPSGAAEADRLVALLAAQTEHWLTASGGRASGAGCTGEATR